MCCCDRAPDGTGHHSIPLKSRPDSLRLLSVPKIRGSFSGTSVIIGWRREQVGACLAPGAAGKFLPWRPRQSSSALADVPGAWWSQYGIKIYLLVRKPKGWGTSLFWCYLSIFNDAWVKQKEALLSGTPKKMVRLKHNILANNSETVPASPTISPARLGQTRTKVASIYSSI